MFKINTKFHNDSRCFVITNSKYASAEVHGKNL